MIKILTIIACTIVANPAFSAAGRFAQMVVTFPDKRVMSHHYEPKEKALVIRFENTSSAELEALHYYNETLVRRVIIKDLGAAGSEAHLVLKDDQVRATVREFHEPYRIIIDIFDRNYRETRDPKTGLAWLSTPAGGASNQPEGNSGPRERVEPADSSEQLSDRSPGTAASGKYRLVQPKPKEITSSSQLAQSLSEIASGLGPAWDKFPYYVYRLQTAVFEGGKNADSWLKKHATSAVGSADALAEYAGKLFDFGHERRALAAYQQVLLMNPLVFDKDALHLWRLAESQLGSGNLALADGYFASLIKKHPGSPLKKFAKIRHLDIRAIRLQAQQDFDGIRALGAHLSEISAEANAELSLQIAIRRAYWSQPDENQAILVKNPHFIPPITNELNKDLSRAGEDVESQKTLFLAKTLSFNAMLANKTSWTKQTSSFAAEYLEKFTGPSTEPFRSDLIAKAQAKLHDYLQTLNDQGKYIETTSVYENLPEVLKDVANDANTSWAVAESYRSLGDPAKAMPFYQTSFDNSTDDVHRFKSTFWLATTTGDTLGQLRIQKSDDARIADTESKLRKADADMGTVWESLKPENQTTILASMKAPLEASITADYMLKTPPKIVLYSLQSNLAAAGSTSSAGEAAIYSPSRGTVQLVVALADRFQALGEKSNRTKSLELLRSIKPRDFKNDPKVQSIWAEKLLDLADGYRNDSRLLEAGRIYAFTGAESYEWEGRASALYKGGLLLFRVGRREEAIEAFKKASEDSNNLLYSELASKRLEQLQQ